MNRNVLFILFLYTSSGCNNLLKYKYKPLFKEFNVIKEDSIFTLNQEVCYNQPGVIDEEYCHELKFQFLDTAAAKQKKKLDLQTDSAIVIASYGMYSVWVWEADHNTVTGEIEILNWDNDKVEMKENVKVYDFGRKKTFKYRGTRTFESVPQEDDK